MSSTRRIHTKLKRNSLIHCECDQKRGPTKEILMMKSASYYRYFWTEYPLGYWKPKEIVRNLVFRVVFLAYSVCPLWTLRVPIYQLTKSSFYRIHQLRKPTFIFLKKMADHPSSVDVWPKIYFVIMISLILFYDNFHRRTYSANEWYFIRAEPLSSRCIFCISSTCMYYVSVNHI